MAAQTSIVRIGFIAVMNASTKGTAHGPPVGFGMTIGFEDNVTLPPPPCVELFSVTEQLWDIGADADGDDCEMVTSDKVTLSPAPSPWLTVIVIGDEVEMYCRLLRLLNRC